MKDRDLVIDDLFDAAGSGSDVARFLGLHRQAVHSWKRIPVKHVLRLETEYGIPRYVMRPDIYPLESPRQSSSG